MLRDLKDKKNGSQKAGTNKQYTITQKPLTINRSLLTKNAQVILEFTFCMIVVLIMIYGVVKAFHWTGRDVVFRRIAHDDVLRDLGRASREQIDPYFYTPDTFDGIWDGF